jgi:hypothetical protein
MDRASRHLHLPVRSFQLGEGLKLLRRYEEAEFFVQLTNCTL